MEGGRLSERLEQATILDKIVDGKFVPHSPPESRNRKMVRFGFRAASSLIWGDGGLLVHFTLSKIVVPGPIKRSFAEET